MVGQQRMRLCLLVRAGKPLAITVKVKLMNQPSSYTPIHPAEIEWRDDQPYSPVYDDIYFSRAGGAEETAYVFLQHNGLPARWQGRERFVIAETGFGTGLNFLVTAAAWLETAAPGAVLYFLSAERHPLNKHDLQRIQANWPEFAALSQELQENYPEPVAGFHRRELCGGRVVLQLMYGDAGAQYSLLRASVDAWYLDGFAPGRNPAMWSAVLFTEMARLSHAGTTLATYTAAGMVRRGLAAAGFEMIKVPGFAGKREMIYGRFAGPMGHDDAQPWFAVPAPHNGECVAVVVGAGLAGAAMAYELTRRGWQVTLVERHQGPAQEASGNPAGVVLPRLTADMDAEGRLYLGCFLAMVARLERGLTPGEEIGWRSSGVVQQASERDQQRVVALDLPASVVQRVDAAQASDLSGVGQGQGGLYFPSAGWLSPPGLCRALLMAAGERLTRRFHRHALRLERRGERWHVIDHAGGDIAEAPVVVLANGYRATTLAQAEGLPLQRVRGQLSYLPVSERSEGLRLPVCYDGYILPVCEGMHVVGASYDSHGFDEHLRVEDEKQMLTNLSRAMPALVPTISSPPAGRVASRTTSHDHLPVVGPLPDQAFYRAHYAALKHGKPARLFPPAHYHPGLYISSGHGSRGLVSCLPAAALLAAQIAGEPWPIPQDQVLRLHPARFLVRTLRRGEI